MIYIHHSLIHRLNEIQINSNHSVNLTRKVRNKKHKRKTEQTRI